MTFKSTLGAIVGLLLIWVVIQLNLSTQFPIPGTETQTQDESVIETIPEEQIERQNILDRAFVTGTTVIQGDKILVFSKKEIGRIKMPTGRLIACDPILLIVDSPFTRTLPEGEYVVEIATIPIEDYDFIAFARIQFTDQTAIKWEMALVPGQDINALRKEEFYGYSVDSGTGSFMDQRGFKELQNRINQDERYIEKFSS